MQKKQTAFRLPNWTRWFLILVGLSVLAPALGSSPSLLYAALIVGIMLLPGHAASEDPRREAPRLYRWLPWIWLLNGLSALLLGIDRLAGTGWFRQPEMESITNLEIGFTVAAVPFGVWAFWRALRWAPAYLLVTWASGLAMQSWILMNTRTADNWIDWGTTLFVDGAVILYLKKRAPLARVSWIPKS